MVYCLHYCSSTSSSYLSSSQDTYRTLGVWLRFLSPIRLKLDFPTDIEVISRFLCNQRRTLKPDDRENKRCHLIENRKVSPNGKQKCVSHLIEGEYFRVLIVRLPSSECWEQCFLFNLRKNYYFEEKLLFWGKITITVGVHWKYEGWIQKEKERLAFSERKEKIIPMVTCRFLKTIQKILWSDLSPSISSFSPKEQIERFSKRIWGFV